MYLTGGVSTNLNHKKSSKNDTDIGIFKKYEHSAWRSFECSPIVKHNLGSISKREWRSAI